VSIDTGSSRAVVAQAAAPLHLQLPCTREELSRLRCGQQVLLSGPIYTMRDAGHARALAALETTGALPFELAGQMLFYAGPTPPAAGRPVGAVGPTTASRMDFATPRLLAAGITGMVGKGTRSEAVRRACVETGSVYFAAVGGAAALLARCVVASETVAWDDLGTEALRRFELADLPVFVAIDTTGADLYAAVADAARTSDDAADAARTPGDAADAALTPDDASSGTFITFEGGEGSGKSTQIAALALLLEEHGYHVLTLREPGGTAVGESIRTLLLDPGSAGLSARSELLLYEAARAQLVGSVIAPALAEGTVVLCDRFYDSTVAYQGYGRCLDLDLVDRMNAFAADGCTPARTIFLDVDVELGLERATEEGGDRLEMEGEGFHNRVREGFVALAAAEPGRVRPVRTRPRRPDTARAIFHELADLFPGLSEDEARRAYEGDTPHYFRGHTE